jgi:hypothetical protein
MSNSQRNTKQGAKAKEVSRAVRLARAYRGLRNQRARKCDVVSVGEGTLHCFTHDHTWSRGVMELGAECPKSRENVAE